MNEETEEEEAEEKCEEMLPAQGCGDGPCRLTTVPRSQRPQTGLIHLDHGEL